MDDVFDDDRFQFFLRNRDDIKAWAALEPEVIAATRELLERSQASIEERVLTIDPTAVTERWDSAPYERIVVRHQPWPAAVGLVLEWHRNVDPLGGYPPKTGVLFVPNPPDLVPVRAKFVSMLAGHGLEQLGYKVPLEPVWPVGARVSGPPDWWTDPASWIEGFVDRLAATWPIVAPVLDAVLVGDPEVSDG